MSFVDHAVMTGEKHIYAVVALNGAGVPSEPASSRSEK